MTGASAVTAALAAAADWPVPHAATGAVWLAADAGDWPAVPGRAASAAWGDTDLVQPWASVTKLLVTMAVLVAVEEGTLALDDPAGPPGATVRHLLAHASGLGPDGGVLAAPGRRRIYSNAGFEALAGALAGRAAMPFDAYLAEGVLEPLGMDRTSLPPGASPAAGARGPAGDLLLLARELLAPTLVAPATLAAAVEVAFPGLPGVVPGIGRFDPCDWALGPELRDGKEPHWTGTANGPATFGHFGRAGSFLWVDPGAGCAGVGLTGRQFGPWALACWPAWSDGVLRAVAVCQDRRP